MGKILNTSFGWATILLFGKVSKSRQPYLLSISLGSVLWIMFVLGTIFPKFAAFVLTFVTLPDWIDDNWVRLAMLGAAVFLPAVIGILSLLMFESERRPQGIMNRIKAVLRGYPNTLG